MVSRESSTNKYDIEHIGSIENDVLNSSSLELGVELNPV